MDDYTLFLRILLVFETLAVASLYIKSLISENKANIYLSLIFSTIILLLVLFYHQAFIVDATWAAYFDLLILNSYLLCVAVVKNAFSSSIRSDRKKPEIKEIAIPDKMTATSEESVASLSEKFVMLTEGSSRELRTIITTIVGYIGLLLDTSLTDQQQEYISDLEKSAENLTSFINNFTTFVKADLKAIEIQKNTLFSIESIFDSIIEKDDILVESSKIELYFIIDENFPLILVGDKKNLTILLRCIIDNAIKFTSRGEITFKANVDHVTGDSCIVSLTVTDTGIGIPKDRMPSIFKALNNRKYKLGFISAGDPGLGIPTADRMAKLFDEGRLDIASKVNEGTTVTFRAKFSLPESRKSKTEYRNRILILASDKYAKSLHVILFRQGYINVDMIDNEEDALNRLSKECRNGKPYDLVLINVHYRRPEVIRNFITSIRNTDELDGLKISIIASKLFIEKVKIPHVDSFIYKPLLIKQAVNTIRNTIKIEGKEASSTHFDNNTSSSNQKLTVLIAEDDNLNRTLLSRIVEKAGHLCIPVNNGYECVETYKNLKGKVDLIFMDYQMPLLDGLEATKEIRKFELASSLKHSKIIGFTASENFKGKCLEAGMDDCLVKPVVVPKVYLVLKESAKM